jgi:hypothetical protein
VAAAEGEKMSRLIMFLFCLTCVFGCDRRSEQDADTLPVDAEITVQRRAAGWIPDPSLEPFPGYAEPVEERPRLMVDVDGDGIEDMLLSAGLATFGNGGGVFDLYLRNKEGLCQYVCDVGGYVGTDTIVVEYVYTTDYSMSRIWSYGRGGGTSQIIVCVLTLDSGKVTKKENFTLFTDADGKISQNIRDAIFTRSDAPVRLEWSITTNNTVIWREKK